MSSSVASIVQKIIEQLTEGVSQLTFLVIQNKESNSAVKPTFALAVDTLVTSCSSLCSVARQVEKEYAEYPAIKEEIEESVKTMESAMQFLSDSTKSLLSGTSRTQGWDGMGNSCKKIAEATTLLLKTVYGAEVRRFFDAAERAKEALEISKANISEITNNPKVFADSASNAASRAAELASQAKSLAADEEAPLMKKKLNDFANDMQLKSNGIIDSANLLLANPNIPNLQQKYRDTLANAEKSVDDINTPLKEKNIQTGALEPNPKNDLKSAQSLMRSLKDLKDASEKLKKNPNDLETQQELEDLLKKIETDSRQLAANAPPNSEIVKLKKEIDKIMARMMPIKGGKIDPTRLLQSAQALANTISELVGHTKSEILINQGVDSASLDKIMGGIENYIKNHPGNGEKVEIDSLLKGLEFMDKLPKNANSPWNSTFENSFSTSNNNNQSLHDVATSVEKAAASARSKSKGTLSKAILQNCDSLASQLDALGNAMQFGSGTQLIESSRSISQLVNTLVNEDLKKLKDKCASPIEQEKLVRCSQALKNLSIQLKILASVNASSGASSSSEESHRLTELALNLGKALVETMNSVHSAELTTK